MSQQLYRLYNAADELLYVGISYSAIARFGQHKSNQPWIDEVTRVTIETHHVGRQQILRMEDDAIHTENPKYNLKRRGGGAHVLTTTQSRSGFDHSDIARSLEPGVADSYRQLVAGLDGVWRHFEREGKAANYRDATVTLVLELFEALDMPDMHDECRADDYLDVRYPIMHDGDRWAFYYCDRCGQYWRCGY